MSDEDRVINDKEYAHLLRMVSDLQLLINDDAFASTVKRKALTKANDEFTGIKLVVLEAKYRGGIKKSDYEHYVDAIIKIEENLIANKKTNGFIENAIILLIEICITLSIFYAIYFGISRLWMLVMNR